MEVLPGIELKIRHVPEIAALLPNVEGLMRVFCPLPQLNPTLVFDSAMQLSQAYELPLEKLNPNLPLETDEHPSHSVPENPSVVAPVLLEDVHLTQTDTDMGVAVLAHASQSIHTVPVKTAAEFAVTPKFL